MIRTAFNPSVAKPFWSFAFHAAARKAVHKWLSKPHVANNVATGTIDMYGFTVQWRSVLKTRLGSAPSRRPKWVNTKTSEANQSWDRREMQRTNYWHKRRPRRDRRVAQRTHPTKKRRIQRRTIPLRLQMSQIPTVMIPTVTMWEAGAIDTAVKNAPQQSWRIIETTPIMASNFWFQ